MNDEKLILYYYKDGLSEAERGEIAAALADDESLKQRYETLTHDLDALNEPDDLPVPEGFEHRLQSSLERAIRIEEAENRSQSWLQRIFTSRFIAVGTAMATVLAVGVGIGVRIGGEGPAGQQPDQQLVIEAPATASPEWSPVAFQRGLETHFRSSRSELDDISPEAASDREELITTLITQNRIYEKLAIQNESPELARVLRSFQASLLQLASKDLTPEEAVELKDKLAFEYSVMLTKLQRQSSQPTEPQNTEMKL